MDITQTAIYFRIQPDLKEKIKQLAKSERRSVSSLINFLLYKKIQEVENAGN